MWIVIILIIFWLACGYLFVRLSDEDSLYIFGGTILLLITSIMFLTYLIKESKKEKVEKKRKKLQTLKGQRRYKLKKLNRKWLLR